MISQQQIDQFYKEGVLVVKNVLSESEVADLLNDFDSWVDESRAYNGEYGETVDGRARFDLERDHSREHPSLRRVSSPTEISTAYKKTALNSAVATIAAQLIGGTGTRFHHSKINAKLPHTATKVDWHQDFLFTPHSNDDVVTALLMVSEVTPENGPLVVIPGSHNGPIFSHWQNDKFVGKVSDSVVEEYCTNPRACYGPVGSVCFMHTRLLHASQPNNTDQARILFISVYAAEDALPFSENPLPSQHAGLLVSGSESGSIRTTSHNIKLPQKPQGASFFVQQSGEGL